MIACFLYVHFDICENLPPGTMRALSDITAEISAEKLLSFESDHEREEALRDRMAKMKNAIIASGTDLSGKLGEHVHSVLESANLS